MESVGGLRRPLRPGRRSFTARHISTLAGCVHPFHRRREIRGGRARIPERRRFANHGGGLLRFSARSVRRRARWLMGRASIRWFGGNRRGGACPRTGPRTARAPAARCRGVAASGSGPASAAAPVLGCIERSGARFRVAPGCARCAADSRGTSRVIRCLDRLRRRGLCSRGTRRGSSAPRLRML